MTLSLGPDLQKLIDERVSSGRYSSPEDVVAAAVRALDQQERFGDFATGELDTLLAEGDQSLAQVGSLDGDEAFRRRCEQREQQRKCSP